MNITKTIKGQDDYPLVLKIDDIVEITGMGKSKCYCLLRSEGFPAFKPKGQSRYIIPRDSFFSWLYQSANIAMDERSS